jgi:hypothetical protein
LGRVGGVEMSENLFVSKYQLYLPMEEELRAEIEIDVFELGLSAKKNHKSYIETNLG